MSAAAAAPIVDAGTDVPVKKGKKKLIIMLVAALLVLLLAGGGAAFFLKKKAAHPAEEGDDATAGAEHKVAKHDPKHPPTFLPLDPFVVNLADKEADRYAQIGITLELENAKFADELKAYMPAIRNAILMIVAHKTSAELLQRSGKEMLATQIQLEAARTMGIDVAEAEPTTPKVSEKPAEGATANGEEEDDKKAKKTKPKVEAEPNPIRHVHFANFIIQ